MHKLAAPIAGKLQAGTGAINGEEVDMNGELDVDVEPDCVLSTQQHVCELLCFCVAKHSYRIKYFILRNNILHKVLKLAAQRDKCLVLAAVRFFRQCIGLKDEFYNRYIIKNKCFEPVVVQLLKNRTRDNLLHSAILELFEFIRKENVKSLVAHLAETYKAMLSPLDHVDIFKGLLLRYDQNEEYRHMTGGGGGGGAATTAGYPASATANAGGAEPLGAAGGGGLSRQRTGSTMPWAGGGRRSFPDEDDDSAYFNASDDEEEEAAPAAEADAYSPAPPTDRAAHRSDPSERGGSDSHGSSALLAGGGVRAYAFSGFAGSYASNMYGEGHPSCDPAVGVVDEGRGLLGSHPQSSTAANHTAAGVGGAMPLIHQARSAASAAAGRAGSSAGSAESSGARADEAALHEDKENAAARHDDGAPAGSSTTAWASPQTAEAAAEAAATTGLGAAAAAPAGSGASLSTLMSDYDDDDRRHDEGVAASSYDKEAYEKEVEAERREGDDDSSHRKRQRLVSEM